jgi:hypothetical protein
LVTKKRRAYHHSEQESVTHFPQTNRSLLGCAHSLLLGFLRRRPEEHQSCDCA